MIRSYLKSRVHLDVVFQPRGTGQDRLESLSDGVFSLAIALLVLSSSTPSNYNTLLDSLANILPFAVTITLIIRIWIQHVLYFYYYGFKDNVVLALNVFLLFLILIYVYPLKFLFVVFFQILGTLLFENSANMPYIMSQTLSGSDGTGLMIIFGIGGCLIYGIYALLYWHAYRSKQYLKLAAEECHFTLTHMYINIGKCAVPLFSVILSIFAVGGEYAFPLAGFCYLLLIPVTRLIFTSRKRSFKKLFKMVK
ncbi:DUF1211 domain-containing protein [Fulvivirga sp. M361]|uniref:TMEM175 family protein n=1 Tax=Fulvivirga sp. M361 TaxID=2594266 RepID=UPI001179BA12|nr:TMEM175 family protein [Fulvivirga sp. M361]TRX49327.1 DUF1211 domain-containing protein [Fulvivirga sp. M361]